MATVHQAHALAKRNFLRLFPKAFRDPAYIQRERNYKWTAHQTWDDTLGKRAYDRLLVARKFATIAERLWGVYDGLNLLSTFESIALQQALKDSSGRRLLAAGIREFIYGDDPFENRFAEFNSILGQVPTKQTKLTKWPIQTLFPFLVNPAEHMFLKPNATKTAAERFGFELNYRPNQNWLTYRRLLELANELKQDLSDWRPRDMIDIQSFIWVTTSEGYASELPLMRAELICRVIARGSELEHLWLRCPIFE